MSEQTIREVVKERYGQAALRVIKGGSTCCGAAPAVEGCPDPISANLYDGNQTGGIPEAALMASLGCGNPTALAALTPGETVLDLGSGGGIDVLLSARPVGPTRQAESMAPLGCGTPVALAEMNPGDTVLGLGSAAGIDVLLSARRVGPTRKAY